MKELHLKVHFLGAVTDTSQPVAVVIDPAHPDFQGEKLKALMKGLRDMYQGLFINIVLDDTIGGGDHKAAMAQANEWIEEYRESLEDWGMVLERKFERLSHLEQDDYYRQKMDDFMEQYRENPKFRSAVNRLAIQRVSVNEDAQGRELGNLMQSRVVLGREVDMIAKQFASLCFYMGMPVITTWQLPTDRHTFERIKDSDITANMLKLPELVRVHFQEQTVERPVSAPVQAEIAPAGSNVVVLFPKHQ